MTIKKQFILLAGLIITIPVLCVLYICVHHYIHSPSRLIIKGPDEISHLDKYNFSANDREAISRLMKSIPPNVDYLLIDNDYNIIYSKIPELPASTKIPPQSFWITMRDTSENFIYQASSINIEGKTIYLVSRIQKEPPHDRPRKEGPQSFAPVLIEILVIVVVFCVALLILIFSNISKSITDLENKTQSIADGNLEEKLEIKDLASNEITSITESLEKMRISLLEAQNQKNKFIMGISHDLRTPVAIIKGYTEALSDGVITKKKEVKNTYELIMTKASQLESMIDTLINFMKLNNTEIRQNFAPESITKLIKNFAKECEFTANVFKRDIKCEIDLTEDILIPMDIQFATRAFENIFNNALRYTRENDSIIIRSLQKNNNIYFSIEDTGIGIDENDLENIFNLFYRGTNSRREAGMGIGLSVVKNIVETHGWTIDVKSKKDQGTCFTITIPINKK
ncbi:MAG: HAMP domain-containing histidine kinase [Treponema sp.]|nr:HAMP domain-containing histidine kinase [Treponema sp.]